MYKLITKLGDLLGALSVASSMASAAIDGDVDRRFRGLRLDRLWMPWATFAPYSCWCW